MPGIPREKAKRKLTARERSLPKEAQAFLEQHAGAIPPDEPRSLSAISLDGRTGADGDAQRARHELLSDHDVSKDARPARVSRKDAPDFDDDLGRVAEWEKPGLPAVSSREADEWIRLATDLVGRLGAVSQYRGHMPVARLPPVTAFAIDGGTIAALPQLRELHLALFPGWRGILRSWFEQRVLGRVETRQRSIPRRQRLADGTAAPFDARERSVQGAESLLKALRSNPRPGVGDVPTGLTPHMLDHLADHANLGKGGRNGGYTVAKAVELAETWAADPAAFERVLRQKQSAKARRRG